MTHPYSRQFLLPAAPTVDEDETEGYEVGDEVIAEGSFYKALDVSAGAAVWQEQGGGAGSDPVEDQIHAATEKVTLADDDEFGIADSEDTFNLKKVLWSTIVSILTSVFDALYSALGHAHAHTDLSGVSANQHHAEDHDHDGSPTQKLVQANTHESADTDTSTSALHHTLGTGANQASPGDHAHASNIEDAINDGEVTKAPTENAVYDALALKLNTSQLEDAINDGEVAKAPTENAVFDALASKVGTTDVQTLTNKRITPRVGTVASSATPAINTDNVDVFTITALAVNITSMTTNLSGTPTDGQTLLISITGTAARFITWGSAFENGTGKLPSTTIGTNRLDVPFVYNAATSKWRCQAQDVTIEKVENAQTANPAGALAMFPLNGTMLQLLFADLYSDILTYLADFFAALSHNHSEGSPYSQVPEAGIVLADNTTNDVSTSKHGFVPKAPNTGYKGLLDSGAWGVVPTDFGDGHDGDVTISGNTTLTTDMEYNNLTINASTTLFTAGYIIRVRGTLVNNGTIDCSGGNGGNGGSGTGSGGAAGTRPYTNRRAFLPVPPAATAGDGASSASTANSGGFTSGASQLTIGQAPFTWLAGGSGSGGGAHGVSDGVGAASAAPNCGARGGNGGAATGTGNSARRGGGGGAGGGVILIFAYVINNAGTIKADGGNGGNATTSTDAGGNGGGGGGGSVVVLYRSTTGSGVGTLSAAGGNAGTGGNGGTAGATGTTYSLQI